MKKNKKNEKKLKEKLKNKIYLFVIIIILFKNSKRIKPPKATKRTS